MNILTWNIQASLGVDGNVDVSRIAAEIKKMGPCEVICLQEVSRFVEYTKDTIGEIHSGMADELWAYFPDYEMSFGPAINRLDGRCRYQFGNMILSRLPIQAVFMHRLPQPADPTTRTMARQMTEIIVIHNNVPLRIMTTHLEFFATDQRAAQLDYLTRYVGECQTRAENPSPSGEGSYIAPPDTNRSILCGDFNLEVNTIDYKNITDKSNALHDAWFVVNGPTTHKPTCGIYDHVQWPGGEHCRDFFFVTEALVNSVVDVDVNTTTNASDHQPLKLTLSC